MAINENFEMISLIVLLFVFIGLLAYSIINNYSLKRNLYFNKELFKDLFLHVKEDILFIDDKGMIIFVNKEAQDILRGDIISEKTHVSNVLKAKGFYSEEDIDCFGMAQERTQMGFKGYMTKEETQGKHLVTGTLIPMFFPKNEYRGTVIVLRDVTQEKRSEEIIYNVTNYDKVTGIPNKNYFMDYLNLSMQTAKIENKMMALFILDLDNFKTVNDIMGHSVGDELLRKVANGVKDMLEHGSQISRIGGDEFTIVIPSANRINDILAISRRLMNLFTDPWELEGKEYYITCSMGIAVYPNDGEDVENLLRNADTALNNAKDLGKNNYKFYTRTMNTSITERFDVENRLRYAVERDQFVLHYQPIIDTKTFEIHSCEALVRWQHPINGLLTPNNFIGIAEDTGLINALGELVLRKACLQHKDWIHEGLPPIKISVNFSGKQFRDSNLLLMIKRVVEETNMDTKYLEMEITESFAMHNIEYVIYILNELKKMGISIAVDDFGTGYSSVKYLKLLPIDVLKIDRSFIVDVEISNAQKEIVKALISLAHGINLKVTAEGVETIEQLNFLKNHKCDKIQGFIFSKPLQSDKFLDFYTKEWQKNEEMLSLR
jgi:polar amino acid transport system substrate-binding protein